MININSNVDRDDMTIALHDGHAMQNPTEITIKRETRRIRGNNLSDTRYMSADIGHFRGNAASSIVVA